MYKPIAKALRICYNRLKETYYRTVYIMEFCKKLQDLRKSRGLTQEELAEKLYVSRTAISKWESGRGYPSIDSLQAIARFFCVSVDELLCTDEMLTIASGDRKQTERHLKDTVIGLVDIFMGLLAFLPLFATRSDGAARAATLLSLDGVEMYLKISYLAIVIATVIFGAFTLASQSSASATLDKIKTNASLVIGAVAVLLFTATLQAYAAAYAFSMLVIKGIVLIKRA